MFLGTRLSNAPSQKCEKTDIRGAGTWKLDHDALEANLDGHITKEQVVLNGNVLEISFVPNGTPEGKRAPEAAIYERVEVS